MLSWDDYDDEKLRAMWRGRNREEEHIPELVANTHAARAFNAKVRDDDRVTLAMVPVGDGMTLEEAVAAAGKFAALISLANLLFAPVWGYVLDRFDRVSALAGAMAIAAIAYTWVGFSPDPLAAAFIPAAIMLGMGEGAAILSGAAVIGQEAPRDIRGSVIGLFNFCGSFGILVIAGLGGILFDAWMPGAPLTNETCSMLPQGGS